MKKGIPTDSSPMDGFPKDSSSIGYFPRQMDISSTDIAPNKTVADMNYQKRNSLRKFNLIIYIFRQISNKRIISKLVLTLSWRSIDLRVNITFNRTENFQKKNDQLLSVTLATIAAPFKIVIFLVWIMKTEPIKSSASSWVSAPHKYTVLY